MESGRASISEFTTKGQCSMGGMAFNTKHRRAEKNA
jgi:hypothetical protein